MSFLTIKDVTYSYQGINLVIDRVNWSIEKGEFHFDAGKGVHHTHEGSIGNLNNGEIKVMMDAVMQKFN